MSNLLNSFAFAFKGVAQTIRDERSVRLQLLAAIGVVAFGAVVGLSAVEWALVALCCGSVLGAELLNTAIEHVVDLASPEWKELAGRAKDAAAGGVLVVSLAAAIVGLVVFVPKLVG